MMRVQPVVLTVLFLAVCSGAAADKGVRIVEPWGAVFGGEPTVFHVEIAPDAPRDATVGWALMVARRAVARGEVPVNNGEARIEVQVPPVRDGIHVKAQMRVQLPTPDGKGEHEATRSLHIFGKNPFASRQKWLRELNLRIYDPEKDTTALFEEEEIPYHIIRDPRRLGEPEGIVIVGEGRKFRAKSSVLAALAEFAERGGRVLVSAPSEGSFHFPGTSDAAGALPSVALRRADVIQDLDKRLDADGWPPDGSLARCAFGVESRHPEVMLSVKAPGEGWPWVSLEYPSGGRMILCAFPIVETWTDSPNARMLFLRLLEELAPEVRGE